MSVVSVMNKCTECNHKFTLAQKIKSMKYGCNKVKCSECGAVYARTSKIYSIIIFAVSVVAALVLYKNASTKMFWNQGAAYAFTIAVFIILNDLLCFLTFNIGKRVKVDDSKYV